MFGYRHDKSERKVDTHSNDDPSQKRGGLFECSMLGRALDKPPFLLAHMHTSRTHDILSQTPHRIIRGPEVMSFANRMNRKVLYTPQHIRLRG
jgi:hypothetical protein